MSFRLDWTTAPGQKLQSGDAQRADPGDSGARASAIRGAVARAHRVQIGFTTAGALDYESPIRNRRLEATSLGRFESSYEYRRYPFRNLLLAGFDVGLGIEASGGRQWLNHQISPAIDIHDTELQAGVAGVLAAHLHRWQRVHVETAWVNGAALVHSNQHHSTDVASSYSSFGGGWLTSLRLLGEVRVARRAAIAIAYARDDGGLMSMHHGITSCGRQVTAGITYGR